LGKRKIKKDIQYVLLVELAIIKITILHIQKLKL